MKTSTYKTFFLIFLALFSCLQLSYSQNILQKRASVISVGGGMNSSGNLQNFGVLGESIVSSQFGNESASGQAGYIYMVADSEDLKISYKGTRDSLILVEIYNTMGGQNWSSSWNFSTPISTWSGVEVSEIDGSVVTLDLNNNNLTGTLSDSVRNFSRIKETDFELNIGNNKLDFESAEDFVGTIPLFVYSPQAKIYPSRDATIKESESITFNSETAGDFNTYQWFKDNTVLVGKTNSTLQLTNVTPADIGSYYCRVTNSKATQLTLERRPIHLNVEGFVNTIDSMALVRIFKETDGLNWKNPWNLNDPVSTWEGVKLVGGKIKELDLSKRNLEGNLPDIFDSELFSELTYLSLFNNNLEGQIPETLGNLTALTYLDLDKNNFEGAVPSSIANLTNLQALWLSRNNLTSLPNEIGNLSNLQNLYIE